MAHASSRFKKKVLQFRAEGLSYRAIASKLCREYGYPVISYGTVKNWIDDAIAASKEVS
jgi:transposase